MIDDVTKAKIIDDYQKGRGSIQGIAREYRVSVADVLTLIGAPELATVEYGGDLIDADEAGPNAKMNYGEVVPIPFTLD